MAELSSQWVEKSFENFEKSLNGEASSCLHGLRKQAFTSFADLGFPSSKEEEWKYTNLAPLSKENFSTVKKGEFSELSRAELDNHLPTAISENALVFVNGLYSAELSTYQEKTNGLTVKSLADVFAGEKDDSVKELLGNYFTKYANFQKQAVVALNTAFVVDGAVIHLKKNARLENPLSLVFVTTESVANTHISPRVLLVAEEGSEGTVLETYLGLGNSRYLTSSVAEVHVASNANLSHYRLQSESAEAFHLSNISVVQEKDSQFKTATFSIGGKLVRNDIHPVLNGTGIDLEMLGLNVLADKQHVDNNTVIDHAEPHCESTELYKGIYAENSRGVFSGTIIVRPDAQKTNAVQSNQSVLLSNEASTESRPQLKIWADDVKCTHGATVGQLDEEALFYLRSRGIPKAKAVQMQVDAFAADIIERIDCSSFKEYLNGVFQQKLADIISNS